MAKQLENLTLDKFNTGLNVVDSAKSILDSDLRTATNVLYKELGEVYSIHADTVLNSTAVVVNGSTATKCLGLHIFNGYMYGVFSNGTESRLFRSSGGDFTQVDAQNFDPTHQWEFYNYGAFVFMVNQDITSIGGTDYAIYKINTSNVLSGAASTAKITSGPKCIAVHLERLTVSIGNTLLISVVEPTGADTDWNTGTVYIGGDTAGYIQIDLDEDDVIQRLVTHFGNLAIIRKNNIHYMTGTTILTSSIAKKTNTTNGAWAALSVAKADTSIYFYSVDGVKQFDGRTVKEGDTNFDTIRTITLDRKIKDLLTNVALSTRASLIGYAHQDKYYLSETSTNFIYVFDEITGGWSVFSGKNAERFIDWNGELYYADGASVYKLNSSTSGSSTSTIRTKEINFGTDQVYKLPHKALFTFRTFASEMTVTISWYINGSNVAAGSVDRTLVGSSITWDSGYKWDDGNPWDSVGINFLEECIRKGDGLKTCKTVSFGVTATGTNRFSLKSIDVLYENKKKGL